MSVFGPPVFAIWDPPGFLETPPGRLWDAALESARRWIAFEPQSLNPRCAEAFAQAGSQDAEQVKEARVRFAQLYKEVTKLEGTKMGDGRWMGVMIERDFWGEYVRGRYHGRCFLNVLGNHWIGNSHLQVWNIRSFQVPHGCR